MLEIRNDRLVFSFPEVHPDCVLEVTLHRTLRIPDDGRQYALPPSLGAFPVRHVDDFAARVPKKWLGRGGVMVPMWQSEALWMSFSPRVSAAHGQQWRFAIKCATGKVSALTGREWSKRLREGDYMVSPEQPWLDGFVVDGDTIRQFVSAPLTAGVSVEQQVTGKSEFGGIQLEVVPMELVEFERRFPRLPPPDPRLGGLLRGARLSRRSLCMKSSGPVGPTGSTGATGPQGAMGPSYGKFGAGLPGVYTSVAGSPGAQSAVNYSSGEISVLSEAEARAKRPEMYSPQLSADSLSLDCMEADMSRGVEMEAGANLDMAMSAGGRMKQQVLKDPYGLAAWSRTARTRVFVHLSNSLAWRHVTGSEPPTVPLSAADYSRQGMPWFEWYTDAPSLQGTAVLKGVKGLAQIAKEGGPVILPENQTVVHGTKVVIKAPKGQVRDGSWAK